MQAQPLSSPAARIPSSTYTDARPPHIVDDPNHSCAASAAGLAHDAGNLLAALHLYVDLLRAPGVLRLEHAHYAQELKDVAERIGRLLHPLVVRQRSAEPHDAPALDLALALSSLTPLLTQVAGASHNLKVFASAPVRVKVLTEESLERIMVNLVANSAAALDRAGKAGTILVRLCAHAGRVKLRIIDDGPGMPHAALQWLLRPHAARRTGFASERRGLGHAVVADLVRASHGRIAAVSSPSGGTKICIEWPEHNSGSNPLRRPAHTLGGRQ